MPDSSHDFVLEQLRTRLDALERKTERKTAAPMLVTIDAGELTELVVESIERALEPIREGLAALEPSKQLRTVDGGRR